MNIKNTMCRLSNLSQREIDSLVSAMPSGEYFDFYRGELFIGFDFDGDAGTWVNIDKGVIVTYTQMMQLLGKTMEFTKSDLIKLTQSETVFVKYRNGDYRVVVGDAICSFDAFNLLNSYKSNMTIMGGQPEFDIISVYKTSRSVALCYFFRGQDLTLIWERTEQTEAQKEMEVLQAQAKALQEQAQAIQEQITKLQGAL